MKVLRQLSETERERCRRRGPGTAPKPVDAARRRHQPGAVESMKPVLSVPIDRRVAEAEVR